MDSIPSKEITVGAKKDVPGSGEKVLIFRFKLEKACHVFDLIIKHFGEALVTVAVKALATAEKGKEKVKLNFAAIDLREAISVYADNLQPGATFIILKDVIQPDHVKYKGENINLEVFYEKHGFGGLLEVFASILEYNFADFLSSS